MSVVKKSILAVGSLVALGGIAIGGITAAAEQDTVEKSPVAASSASSVEAPPEPESAPVSFETQRQAFLRAKAEADAADAAAAAQAGPRTTFGDGTWTVGTDIAAGVYKVTAPVSDADGLPYWKISVTGSNGSDILDNDLPNGGLPQVTLKDGQDFKTDDCGTWAKIG